LQHRYETLCDPRLNYTQSLDMAFHIARLITSIQPQKLLAQRRKTNSL